MIFHSTCPVVRSHVKRVPVQAQQELFSGYADRGFRVEDVNGSYILWPPEPNNETQILLEEIERSTESEPELNQQKHPTDDQPAE